MVGHRFKLGQVVTAHAPGVPAGPYAIIRLLPLVGKDPHYQGRSEDGIVRALLESQIRAVPEASGVQEIDEAPRLPERGHIRNAERSVAPMRRQE